MKSAVEVLTVVSVVLSVVHLSYSSASRSAYAIGYEAEDVADDTATYCKKIRNYAEEIRNETLDARDEVGFMDTVAAEESMFAYDYIIVKSEDVIMYANECIAYMNESSSGNDSIVAQAENIGSLLEEPTHNKTQLQELLDAISADIDADHLLVKSWGMEIAHLAENIIAAARDAQQEIAQGAGTSDEALEDAKDTKTEVRDYAEEIIELTEDMIHDAFESYEGDMKDDIEDVLESL